MANLKNEIKKLFSILKGGVFVRQCLDKESHIWKIVNLKGNQKTDTAKMDIGIGILSG